MGILPHTHGCTIGCASQCGLYLRVCLSVWFIPQGVLPAGLYPGCSPCWAIPVVYLLLLLIPVVYLLLLLIQGVLPVGYTRVFSLWAIPGCYSCCSGCYYCCSGVIPARVDGLQRAITVEWAARVIFPFHCWRTVNSPCFCYFLSVLHLSVRNLQFRRPCVEG